MKSDNELKTKAYQAVKNSQDKVRQDPYRLHYHIMPSVGLLNDPNGFVYYQGKYHLFYQWNPFGTNHSSKFWGHFSSKNLVDWHEEPIALAPSSWFDKNGCYSGSAIVHEDQLYLFYTGNVRDENGDRETYQCLAISSDGVNFDKKGPVVQLPNGYTAHFRDPKVWKHEEKWYMIIGAQTEQVTGTVVLYESIDLISWRFLGPITERQDFGYMWECPDLFSLNDKDVLLFSPQGIEPEGYHYQNIYQSGYFVGKLDYQEVSYQHGRFEEIDRGFDFYAPQTTVDNKGRRLMFGWMGVPEENEQDHPTISHHWIHALTMPRQLELKDGKLFQHPVEELVNLRKEAVIYSDVVIKGEKIQMPRVNGNAVELFLEVKENASRQFSVSFGNNTQVLFDQENKLVTLKRKSMKSNQLEKRQCHLNDFKNVRIFLDASSIEIFINGGEEVFTTRIFDDVKNDSIYFHSTGKMIIDINKWELKQV
ncbi:sucrose-6-phosphate hydrolase [Aquibacillus halophilus]|uniref:Sucrose-6-phosphate hydrolase n=1 Tax=Aquibacillus halophilus TaxID=930132 RepID=A0A6A8D6G3_9BACI|nr:sucrose-6-phosphate hydrolase [Aquibacillus halophilus]